MHCSENRFCAALDPIARSRLCQVCTKATYAAGTTTSLDYYKHFLVIEGLCCMCHRKVSSAYRPGDFVVTPHANTSREPSVLSVSFDEERTRETKVRFITDVTLAFFSKDAIDEFLEDPAFLAVSYRNLEDLYIHLTAYFVNVYCSSAYDAVAFVLKYSQHNAIGHLTHEQIAALTGISRTTVTTTLHQIALAQPELLG